MPPSLPADMLMQAELEASQAEARQLANRLRQAQERADPAACIPMAKARALAQELDSLQAQHDALERQIAALQHGPGPAGSAGQQAPAAGHAGQQQQQHEQQWGTRASQVLLPGGGGDPGGGGAAAGVGAAPMAYLPSRYSAGGGLEEEGPLDDDDEEERDAGTGAKAGQPSAQWDPAPAVVQPAQQPAWAEQRRRLEQQLLEMEVRLFDVQLERDQALAQATRLRRRMDDLFAEVAGPQAAAGEGGWGGAQGGQEPAAEGAAGDTAAVARGVPRDAAGRPVRRSGGQGQQAGQRPGRTSAAGRQPVQASSAREQELLDTVALLKAALERTRRGLESGVSASKFMQVGAGPRQRQGWALGQG